jgi:hypothetical protein
VPFLAAVRTPVFVLLGLITQTNIFVPAVTVTLITVVRMN